jgi:Ni/Fe-hydrogenase subunit HybB-like protein
MRDRTGTVMNNRVRMITDVLWAFALAGLVASILRLRFGLGATTNLTDAVPWGLWKIFNMVAGVALSTGGFTVGFLVYVLRLKRFQPFVKPAILIAFLGYGCSCTALLFDIGLPYRFWHPILMWNFNSFLFEVFWCVLLYFTVTAIELAPSVFERLRAEKIARWLHHVSFWVVVFGISLSSLHHSSLGSLFLLTPQRLHPLWYSPWLPLLFITSAMGSGLMVVVLVRMLWAWCCDPEPVFGPKQQCPIPIRGVPNGNASGLVSPAIEGPEMASIRSLAGIGAGVLGLYFLLKVADLFLHGGLQALVAGSWESRLYLVELTFNAVLPVLLLLLPWSRRSPAGILIAAASAAFGLALNRLDVGIFGYFRDAGVVYFPSAIEWAVGLGVVAAAGLVFFLAAENLAIFSQDLRPEKRPAGIFRLSFGNIRQLWNTVLTDSLHRVTLLAVFVVPLAFVLMYPPYHSKPAPVSDDVRPAKGVDVTRTVLRIDGNQRGELTLFHHAEHQKRLGGKASCVKCHHMALPNDRSTPCSRCHRSMNTSTNIFDHAAHEVAVAERQRLAGMHPTNLSCVQCHDAGRPKTTGRTRKCLDCHKTDMFPAATGPLPQNDLRIAPSFRDAMHQCCVTCHRTEAIKQGKPDLADCRTCHESLRPRKAPAVTHYVSGGKSMQEKRREKS